MRTPDVTPLKVGEISSTGNTHTPELSEFAQSFYASSQGDLDGASGSPLGGIPAPDIRPKNKETVVKFAADTKGDVHKTVMRKTPEALELARRSEIEKKANRKEVSENYDMRREERKAMSPLEIDSAKAAVESKREVKAQYKEEKFYFLEKLKRERKEAPDGN